MLRSKWLGVGISCVVSLALVAGMSLAQDEKKGDDSKSADKAKGKLPNYFAKIGLTAKQQDEVRKAAQPFDEKIVQLHKQIKDLDKQVQEQEAAKEAACEKLLTEQQRATLKDLKATVAAEKEGKKKGSKKSANGDGNKPEEKKPEEKKPEQK